jgi:hypothetical protein
MYLERMVMGCIAQFKHSSREDTERGYFQLFHLSLTIHRVLAWAKLAAFDRYERGLFMGD